MNRQFHKTIKNKHLLMKYFNSITDLEQAKQHYRTLAKQLHPDKGGTAVEFQKMQDEYKALLLS